LSADDELARLGVTVDLAQDAANADALEATLTSLENFRSRSLTPAQRGRSHFYSANALAALRYLQREESASWWNQPLLERELLQLRLAMAQLELTDDDGLLRCQVLTNYANALNGVGRPIEALQQWNVALATNPGFGMALGNRGLGLYYYSQFVQTAAAQSVLLHDALRSLQAALDVGVEPHAYRQVMQLQERIQGLRDWSNYRRPQLQFLQNLDAAELRYRLWCRHNCLYLSPLNDSSNLDGIEDIVDELRLPAITTPVAEGSEPPVVYGMFNQAKQEYASARYLVYEALLEREQPPHFADKDLALVNVLDYRLYRLWVERLKMAFISAHAIFDKLAYLMNEYWKFGLKPNEVSFGGLWHKRGKRGENISTRTKELTENWPLRGLFWLSRDFYDRSELPHTIAPDARMVHEIRNHIAHKYLRVHDELIGALDANRKELPRDFSFQVTGTELGDYTMRLLKLVRCAMVYLVAAVELEEFERVKLAGSGLVVPLHLPSIGDDERL